MLDNVLEQLHHAAQGRVWLTLRTTVLKLAIRKLNKISETMSLGLYPKNNFKQIYCEYTASRSDGRDTTLCQCCCHTSLLPLTLTHCLSIVELL